MAYADTKARLVVHAATAGAAITEDPILDVQVGFAVPKERCVRVYYGGEAEPARMGGRRVLNAELVAEVTFIELFLPVVITNEAVAAVIDSQFYAFKHALRTAINGDSQLNGNNADLDLEYPQVDIILVGTTRFLNAQWRCISDFTEYPVAP